jgi:hypothetical protein
MMILTLKCSNSVEIVARVFALLFSLLVQVTCLRRCIENGGPVKALQITVASALNFINKATARVPALVLVQHNTALHLYYS